MPTLNRGACLVTLRLYLTFAFILAFSCNEPAGLEAHALHPQIGTIGYIDQQTSTRQKPSSSFETKKSSNRSTNQSARVELINQLRGDDWAIVVKSSNWDQQVHKAIVDSSRNDIFALSKALRSLQNPVLFGGDILIRSGSNQKTTKQDGSRKYERSALVSMVSLWPEGIIFYELDPSVNHLTGLIWRVMQQFHDETCIKFIPRQNNEPDYIRIEDYRGCFSYIGRIGGEQTVSLGDGCEYQGTIAHELLHAVGFYHHQNRSDRDDFLEIIWDNIARGKENQFAKMAPQENLLLNTFDYNSIMLYGPRTFGKTFDKVTMKPKRKGVRLLEVMEKKGLSLLDIDSVNKLYECGNIKR